MIFNIIVSLIVYLIICGLGFIIVGYPPSWDFLIGWVAAAIAGGIVELVREIWR